MENTLPSSGPLLLDQVETDHFFETYGIRVLRSMRQIIRAVDIHSRKLNSEFKITAPQLLCLYSLVKEGSVTLSRLAKSVNLSVSTVNGVVDRLESKGLLTRQRDSIDRRRVFISITDTGKEITRSAPMLLQDQFSEALRQLPELEQVAIALSLERVVELMGADHLEASPNLLPHAQINEQKTETSK
jgi:DNA-binding MarR family transcriptional regulator